MSRIAAVGAAPRAGSMAASYVIHERPMDESPLTLRCALKVALAAVLGGVGPGACGGRSAGGRPADGGPGDVETADKLARPDADCPPDAAGGGGFCPINFCGQVKSVATLAAGEMASAGADALCTP